MSERTPWRYQILIYLLAFGTFFLQSVLLPVLPRYGAELDISVAMMGVMLSARFVVPAFFAAQLGSWTSRFGLKNSLIVVSIGMFATTYLYIIANSLTMLFIAQIVSGTFYLAAWIAAQTYSTRVPDRDFVVGIFATITAVGMTVGPIVGGYAMDHFGFNGGFFAYAAGALMLLVTAVLLGDHAAGKPTEKPNGKKGNGDITLLLRPGIQVAFIFSFICLFLISVRGNYLPLMFEANGMNATTVGLILAAGSLGQAVVRPFTQVLIRSFNMSGTLLVAASIAIVGLALIPATGVVGLLVTFALVHGMGAGLHQSLGLTLLADYTTDQERGYAVGLRATINQISSAAAPLVAGFLAGGLGMEGAVYVIAALMAGLLFWLYAVIQKLNALTAQRKEHPA